MPSRTPFRLKKACSNCPFRADTPFYGLRPARVREIADSLRHGDTFSCHKTLDYSTESTEETGAPAHTAKTQFCAGALATMERAGAPNQAVRIAERLGIYDPTEFDAASIPVYESLDEWETALVARYAGIDHLATE